MPRNYRQETNYPKRYQHLLNDGLIKPVARGSVEFVSFRKKQFIGTPEFNYSSAVIIMSKFGAILAHIAADPRADENNVAVGIAEVKAAFEMHSNFFPTLNTQILLIHGDAAVSPKRASMIEKALEDAKLVPTHRDPIDKKARRRLVRQGTVVVTAGQALHVDRPT